MYCSGGGGWVVSPEVPPSHLSQIRIESLFIPQWGNYTVKKKPIWVLNDWKYNVFFLKKQYLYLWRKTQLQHESGEDRRRKCPWLSRSCSLQPDAGDHMVGLMNVIQSCCRPPCDHGSESVNSPLDTGWNGSDSYLIFWKNTSASTPLWQSAPTFPQIHQTSLVTPLTPHHLLCHLPNRGKRKYQTLPLLLLLPVFRSSSLAPG